MQNLTCRFAFNQKIELENCIKLNVKVYEVAQVCGLDPSTIVFSAYAALFKEVIGADKRPRQC